jgi:ribose transport system permease protein
VDEVVDAAAADGTAGAPGGVLAMVRVIAGVVGGFFSKHRRFIIDYSAWFLLIILVVIGAFSNPLFLTTSNLYNVLQLCTIIGVLSLGQFLVILTGGIDLSLGSVLALASMVAALAMPYGVVVAVVAALLTGLIAGAISGSVAVFGGMPPFIVTFAMMAVARGIALTITNSARVAVHGSPLAVFGFGWQPIAVWAVAIAILAFVVNRTAFGTHIYAVGGNLEAARVAGINVRAVLVWVFAISGMCAALGGLLTLARTGVALPTTGNGYELEAIAAVAIGGCNMAGGEGKFSGAVAGVMFMTILRNILELNNANPYWSWVFIGLVLWGAISLRTSLERIR